MAFLGGGAVYWKGKSGALTNCNFINNTSNKTTSTNTYKNGGGAVLWMGSNGIIKDCHFIGNIAIKGQGGGIFLEGINCTLSSSTLINNSAHRAGAIYLDRQGTISSSTFINNTAGSDSGAVRVDGSYCTLSSSTFINNTAGIGGAVYVGSSYCTLSSSTFINNTSRGSGGAVYVGGSYCTLSSSTFINNTAIFGNGGAIQFYTTGSISKCSFNSKWINNNSKSNGIYAQNNLNINGGNGIVDIVIQGTLSGISVVVLNNETYYYPPNTNINFTDNRMIRD